MSGAEPGQHSFSSDWLDLRCAVDSAARDQRLEGQLKRLLAAVRKPIRIVDLGCGNGANLRHLSPRLGANQSWELVDQDPRLLLNAGDRLRHWTGAISCAPRSGPPDTIRLPGKKVTVRYRRADIRTLLSEWKSADLITGSALIDLVSAPWLDALVRQLTGSGAIMLFTLAYNGRWQWSDYDPLDAEIATIFDADQRRDKGFGNALGPFAAAYLGRRLRHAGYHVAAASSPWEVEPFTELRSKLLAGVREVIDRFEGGHKKTLVPWIERRENSAAALRLGHFDLLAWPGSRRRGTCFKE